jgi:hypothetical protein
MSFNESTTLNCAAGDSSAGVLIASPVYRDSKPFFPVFLEAWRSISYPNARFCIVENNISDTGVREWLSGLDYIRRPGDLRIERIDSDEGNTGWDTLTKAQNKIREVFLSGEDKFLLLNETSRPCAPDLVARLIAYEKPVIGALYKCTYHPGLFCVYDFDPSGNQSSMEPYALIDRITEPAQVYGMGFGAILIHRKVIERVVFRSAEYAADTYFFEDLSRLQVPVFAAPIVVENLKIECDSARREHWDSIREEVVNYATTGTEDALKNYLNAVEWDQPMQQAKEEIAAVVPPNETFILVDQDEWETDEMVAGRRRIPFPEQEGQYAGPPPDDQSAILELERLRQMGAAFLVFAWPAFWWLDYYSKLQSDLRSKYHCVLKNDRLVIFDLRTGLDSVSTIESSRVGPVDQQRRSARFE